MTLSTAVSQPQALLSQTGISGLGFHNEPMSADIFVTLSRRDADAGESGSAD
jgi:hypothetical protein